ncbi:hypothetical protein RDABS01_034005 [Bienertia sinuspersici]
MAEIKLISESFVKPKCEVETAKHPYHLSPIDIGMLSMHPIQKGLLYTVDNQPNSSDRSQIMSNLLDKIKHSLSIVLLHFYPLAGRFATKTYPDENACSVYVDCLKGPGARLIHATAPCVTLSDILSSTDVPTFVQLLFDLGEKSASYDGHTRALVSIQVTELIDGVFIGFTMNHSVVDENNNTKISRVPVFDYKPWASDDDRLRVLKLPCLEPGDLIVRFYDTGLLRERIFSLLTKSNRNTQGRG